MVAIDGSYCCPVVADEGLAAGHPYFIFLPPSSCPLGYIINFFVLVFSYEAAQWIKNSICTAGDTGDMGSIPGSGKSLGEGHGNPLQYFAGESPAQRSLEGCSPWDHRESNTNDATEHTHI